MVNRKYSARAAAFVTAFACMVGTIGCQSTSVYSENKSFAGSLENQDSVGKTKGEETDSWKAESYQEIVFEGDRISAAAYGVTVEGTTVTITTGGTYVLSGVLDNGRIVVDASKEDKVTLVWNGAEIFCEDTSPVYVEKADKTIFYLADGTENVISDGENYSFASGETEPDAAVFAKDDLIIKGSGSLTVNANYYDGIFCKNDLEIMGGNLTVNAVNQGIKGKDSLTIQGGVISVTAGDDGIKSSNEALVEEDGKEVGWVKIEDGIITVAAGDDAIHAESDLTIDGGTIIITESYEGLEGGCIYINGGEISLYASDDGVNAAGYAIEGAVLNQSERRNPENEAGGDWRKVPDMPPSEENPMGMEGNPSESEQIKMPVLEQEWGNRDGRGDREAMGTVSSGGYLEINGGNLYVNAKGDGIDVNGSIVMNGGVVQIDGTESGGDGAIDYDSTFEINGGVLVGVGNRAMAQTATAGSTQYCMAVYFDTIQKAESVITVQDASGKEILSYKPKNQYSFFTFSSKELKAEDTYTILVDQIENQSLVMSDVITASGNAFSMGSEGFGGGFHGRDHGGMPREGTEAEGQTPPERREFPNGEDVPGRGMIPEGMMPEGTEGQQDTSTFDNSL